MTPALVFKSLSNSEFNLKMTMSDAFYFKVRAARPKLIPHETRPFKRTIIATSPEEAQRQFDKLFPHLAPFHNYTFQIGRRLP